MKVYGHLGKGSVLGVIPKEMEAREVSGNAVGEVRVVDDMHTRKALMAAEASAFICLPGGYGTLEVIHLISFRFSTNGRVVSYGAEACASIWGRSVCRMKRLTHACSLFCRRP